MEDGDGGWVVKKKNKRERQGQSDGGWGWMASAAKIGSGL